MKVVFCFTIFVMKICRITIEVNRHLHIYILFFYHTHTHFFSFCHTQTYFFLSVSHTDALFRSLCLPLSHTLIMIYIYECDASARKETTMHSVYTVACGSTLYLQMNRSRSVFDRPPVASTAIVCTYDQYLVGHELTHT